MEGQVQTKLRLHGGARAARALQPPAQEGLCGKEGQCFPAFLSNVRETPEGQPTQAAGGTETQLQ